MLIDLPIYGRADILACVRVYHEDYCGKRTIVSLTKDCEALHEERCEEWAKVLRGLKRDLKVMIEAPGLGHFGLGEWEKLRETVRDCFGRYAYAWAYTSKRKAIR